MMVDSRVTRFRDRDTLPPFLLHSSPLEMSKPIVTRQDPFGFEIYGIVLME
jgi:hypothetical protein